VRVHHPERHRYARVGWLRAAVLGANDGIVSVASILLGVAAATSSQSQVAVAGIAALVAGALAMAAGEFVSVSSQRDTERADIARERREILQNPDHELTELQEIYQLRGLDEGLAGQVAQQLMAADPLGAHLRDELGMVAIVSPSGARVPVVAAVALVLLAAAGALGGRFGGAPVGRAALRVLAGGSVAMLITWLIGILVGSAV
jgi:vacuolar iron transporter family protein